MGRPSPVVVNNEGRVNDLRHCHVRSDPVRLRHRREAADAMSYYGCTATGHVEFTCLQAYYVGPKGFKKFERWCDNCKERYIYPGEGEK